jgi:hypothetical protein
LDFPRVEAVGRFSGQEAVVLCKPNAFFPYADAVAVATWLAFVGDAEFVAQRARFERVALVVDARRAR